MRKLLTFIAFASWVTTAHAGSFSCHAFFTDTKYDCAALLAPIATDEFTSKFPRSKYQIVVISASTRYDNGKSSGFAMVGMSPVGTPRVPSKRYTVHFTNWDMKPNAQVQEDERNAVKDAFRDLMAAELPSHRRNTPRSERRLEQQATQESEPQPHYPQIVCKQPQHIGDQEECGYE